MSDFAVYTLIVTVWLVAMMSIAVHTRRTVRRTPSQHLDEGGQS